MGLTIGTAVTAHHVTSVSAAYSRATWCLYITRIS